MQSVTNMRRSITCGGSISILFAEYASPLILNPFFHAYSDKIPSNSLSDALDVCVCV